MTDEKRIISAAAKQNRPVPEEKFFCRLICSFEVHSEPLMTNGTSASCVLLKNSLLPLLCLLQYTSRSDEQEP